VSRVRTVVFGSGGFGIASLRRLARHPDIEVVAVVTAPPRPAGRSGKLTSTPFDDAARELAIDPVLRPPRLRAPEAVAEVLALAPELAVLADYGQLVPAPILELPSGALNLHPSLLPRHRGATPIPATILAGDPETGVSLFRMDAGLDTGPVVARSSRELRGDETAPELEEALAMDAADLLERSIGPWVRGDLQATPQDDATATLTRPLRRDDGRLDPARPTIDLERQVRALQPWPGSWVDTLAGRLTVLAASVEPSVEGDVPGHLVGDRRGLALATADGRLRLHRVQPAGRTPMDATAFLNGRPGLVGSAIR
jgi:methionyl-tRNA formyltransferase